jgi:hypothetical protein
MADASLSRRTLLAAGGAVVLGAVVGCGGSGGPVRAGPVKIYRLSLDGRRGSNAGKSHNANMRFVSAFVADANRAHPGDNSKIVPLVVSLAEFERLFGPGPVPSRLMADLRHL